MDKKDIAERELDVLANKLIQRKENYQNNQKEQLLDCIWYMGKEICETRFTTLGSYRELSKKTGINYRNLQWYVKFYEKYPDKNYEIKAWRKHIAELPEMKEQLTAEEPTDNWYEYIERPLVEHWIKFRNYGKLEYHSLDDRICIDVHYEIPMGQENTVKPFNKKLRMFQFLTEKPYNPMGGECSYNCKYCWAKGYIKKRKMIKYQGPYHIFEKMLDKRFKEDDYIWLDDMNDALGDTVPKEEISKLFTIANNNEKTRFLLLTKNPGRYLEFTNNIPLNMTLGATIESDRNYPQLSNAPSQSTRIHDMIQVREQFPEHSLFICIEPILDFDAKQFIENIASIKPELTAVGLDSLNNNLPEPERMKVIELINRLREFTDVEPKMLER